MFSSNKDQAKRDAERAGESAKGGDAKGASEDVKRGAQHSKEAATEDDRTMGEKAQDKMSAMGDQAKAASERMKANWYDTKAESSKFCLFKEPD